MAQLSKEDIVERVKLFVESVRRQAYGFKSEKCWWLVSSKLLSTTKYLNAITLLDQLGIPEGDMKKHFTAYWPSRIGDNFFRDCFHRGLDEKCLFVTVRTKDNEECNKSTLDGSSKVIKKDDDFRTTRYSKEPWEMLRHIICGDTISLSTTNCIPTKLTGKRKRNPELNVNMPIAEEVEEEFVEEGLDGSTVDQHIMEPFSYWRSAEAKKLFHPMPEDETILHTLVRRIHLLEKAASKYDTWKLVINDGDDRDLCTKSDVHNIKIKIYLLRKTYQLAIQYMEPNTEWTWEHICREAIQEMKSAIGCKIKSYKTLGQYNIEFRKS